MIKIRKPLLVTLFVLLIFFNPFLLGHRIAILTIPVLFLLVPKTFTKLDFNFFLILLFSVCYFLFEANSEFYEEHWRFNAFFCILPASLYVTGSYLGRVLLKQGKLLTLCKYLIVTFWIFSFVPILSILSQINKLTFVDGERSMYLLWSPDHLFSATVIGNYLTFSLVLFVILIIFPRTIGFSKFFKFGIFVFSVLSLICIVRLGNRTQLVACILTTLFLLFVNKRFLKIGFNKLVFRKILILFVVFVVVLNFISLGDQLFHFYQDRIDSGSSGVGTAGGRVKKWISAIDYLIEFPLGWRLNLGGYAHNVWLDIARVSGVIPFTLFVFVSIKNLFDFRQFLTLRPKSLELYYVMVCFFVNIYIVFFMEPAIEGMFLSFLMYFFFWGVLKSIVNDGK